MFGFLIFCYFVKVMNSVPGVVTRHRNKNEEKAELLNQEQEIGGSNRSTPQPGSSSSSNNIIKQEIKEEKETDDARCVVYVPSKLR